MRRTRFALPALAVALAVPLSAGVSARPAEPWRAGRVVTRLTAPPWQAPLARPAKVDSYTPRYAYEIPRATTDRADLVSGRQIHVIYFLPADVPDEELDKLGVIDVSMLAQNVWLAGQTAGSGVQQWVFDTFQFTPAGAQVVTAVDVSFVRGPKVAADYAVGIDTIVTDVRAAGFRNATKRYLIYAAVPTGAICGESYYPVSTGLGPVDGQYSAVYLDSVHCGARDFAADVVTPGQAEAIAQHEMIHNDGVVPPWAPHHCLPLNAAHVCTTSVLATSNLDPERSDLMFPYANGKLSTKVLDRWRDDYYKPFHRATWDLSRSLYLTP